MNTLCVTAIFAEEEWFFLYWEFELGRIDVLVVVVENVQGILVWIIEKFLDTEPPKSLEVLTFIDNDASNLWSVAEIASKRASGSSAAKNAFWSDKGS